MLSLDYPLVLKYGSMDRARMEQGGGGDILKLSTSADVDDPA